MAFLIYEVPIGSKFPYNGTTYEVVESSDSKKSRLDGKDVIFKSLT